jgi:hypothetical protein
MYKIKTSSYDPIIIPILNQLFMYNDNMLFITIIEVLMYYYYNLHDYIT